MYVEMERKKKERRSTSSSPLKYTSICCCCRWFTSSCSSCFSRCSISLWPGNNNNTNNNSSINMSTHVQIYKQTNKQTHTCSQLFQLLILLSYEFFVRIKHRVVAPQNTRNGTREHDTTTGVAGVRARRSGTSQQ